MISTGAGVAEPFLTGGGDMALRIAGQDWSGSLGPIAAWPVSLKTTVGLMLHSPVPLVLLWGTDGIMIYNDAYSQFAGARRFWTAHLWSPRPGEKTDIHGQCRLVFLERIAQKWTYLGHYLVDCAPVRRRGNRIGYEYNDAYIYFTVDEKGPPAKVERFSIRASHFVFIK